MKSILLLFISSHLLLQNVIANDSTELYKKRVEKLKRFSEWLSIEAKEEKVVEGIFYQYDSATNKNWKTFDKAIALFFNKRILDSIVSDTTGQGNIFTPESKAKMVKGFISRFNDLSHRVLPDSLKFRPQNLNDIAKENESAARNTIIQYFVIESESIVYLYFRFEEHSTNLISMIVAEPVGEEGIKFIKYYQKLKRSL